MANTNNIHRFNVNEHNIFFEKKIISARPEFEPSTFGSKIKGSSGSKHDIIKLNTYLLKPVFTPVGIKNKHAFLDLLLLSEIDGVKIDDESVREEVDTFMFEVIILTLTQLSW